MKNGCKEFKSRTMDKINIQSHHENRLHDIQFATVYLSIANHRGHCLNESLDLVKELYEYIIYLYSKVEQLEKDKRYLLEQRLRKERK